MIQPWLCKDGNSRSRDERRSIAGHPVIVRHDPGLDQKLQDIRSETQRKGIEALMLEATTGKALELAFTRLRSERCEAVYVASGPLGPAKRARIIALASEARLPAMYSFRIFPAEGGLMSFAASLCY